MKNKSRNLKSKAWLSPINGQEMSYAALRKEAKGMKCLPLAKEEVGALQCSLQ